MFDTGWAVVEKWRLEYDRIFAFIDICGRPEASDGINFGQTVITNYFRLVDAEHRTER